MSMWMQNFHKCEEDYSHNPSTCICENSEYFKIIVDTSMIECDEIIIDCYERCINKEDNYYGNKCCKYYFNKLAY